MQSSEQLTKLATALGGLPVLGCRPGSPAARAGIRYGDVLLSVNGMPTPDWNAYVEARHARARAMKVAIFRAGEELEIELVFDAAPADSASWLDYLTGADELD
ncbi:MAG TPA: PDZ domain-containing protein [Kofleriaceae bacterium]